MSQGNVVDISVKREELKGKEVVVVEQKKVPESKDMMRVLAHNKKVYDIDLSKIDESGDCFNFQSLGKLLCSKCPIPYTKCAGGKSKSIGINEFGHKVPIAIEVKKNG